MQPKHNGHGGLKARYEVEVRDKDGKLLKRIKGKSHSFVQGFITMLSTYLQTGEGGTFPSVTITDTGGTGRSLPMSTNSSASMTAYQCMLIYLLGASGQSGYGILVGTGTGATAITDTKLGTQIATGTGANQMVYNQQSVESVVVSAPNASIRSTRTFTNNSGSTIVVSEIGWAWGQYYASAWGNFLLLHDLLTTAISVPTGATATVRYTLSVSN